MADYYGVSCEEYIDVIKKRGLILTRAERDWWSKEQKKKNTTTEKESEKSENLFVYHGIKNYRIPNFVICALYNVPYELIDGKRVYDQEEFIKAEEKLHQTVQEYMLDSKKMTDEKNKEDYSKLKPIDLVAMRMYRGFNRKEFSRLSKLPIGLITQYESKNDRVTKKVASIYTRTLSINKSHVMKLRAIMNGENTYVEEVRDIPKIIKLEVWMRDNGRCTRCSCEDKIHYHHIKRFAEGGLHTKDNIILLCAACHAEEHKGEKAYFMLKKMAEK